MKLLDGLQSLIMLLLVGLACQAKGEHVYCSVVEAQPPGTLVCDLAEKIGQSKVSPSHQYQLINRPSDYLNYFEVHSNKGQLILATTIDREAIKQCRDSPDRPCKLDLAVTFSRDRDDQTNMQLIDVVVTLEDINDNAPTFKEFRSPVQFSIREHDRSVRIQLPKADDPDCGKNGTVVYSFPPEKRHQNDYLKFAVEEDRGNGRNPVLTVVGDIDLEGDDRVSNRIELLIQASDDGSPPRAANLSVVIIVENTNDFDPVFEPGSKVHSLSVKENATVNSVIFTVRATDRDETSSGPSSLRYKIRPSDPPVPFSINQLNGDIRLRSALNAEARQDYSFDVEVSDNHRIDIHRPNPRTAVMTVNIKVEDVNDNQPEIRVVPASTKYRLSVQENKASAMIAIVEVSDKDIEPQNRLLDCDLARFNQQTDAFVLQADSRNDQGLRFILKNSRPLDREIQPEFRLSLACSDSSGLSAEKHFSVTVRDENDSPPTFPESVTRLSFPENQPPHTFIGAVVAHDADEGGNAVTKYEMADSCAGLLGIGERNGSLYSLVPFDRELNASLVCTVRAYDANRTDMSAVTSVHIEVSDLNDSPPVFRTENLTFHVPENHRPAIVGRVEATDADAGENGRLSYSLAQPSPAFRISLLGEILLVGSGLRGLNREQQSSYSLRVRVQDHGQPPLTAETLVSIEVIDENDNSPRFVFPSSRNSSLNVSVHERPGTLVAKVTALDDDAGQNGQLTFGLDLGGCDRDLFRLVPESGHLLLAHSVPQNYADRVVCQLSIFASDRGTEPRRSSQGLTVRFTGAQPRSSPGGAHGADSVGSGDVGAAGSPGRKGPRDLIVITVCVALSFLVLLCVVLLLAYFCYYLQMPALGPASRDQRERAATGRGAKPTSRGKLSSTHWLSRLGFGGRSGGDHSPAGTATVATAGRAAVGSSFISPPILQMKAPGVAGDDDDDDDEFGTTAMPQFYADRRVSAAATLCGPEQYRHRRGSDNVGGGDFRGTAVMTPLYSEGTGGGGGGGLCEENQTACGHDYQTVAVDVARRRLNYLGVDSKMPATSSYYKSLRPPSTDPARRRAATDGCRRHQQQPQAPGSAPEGGDGSPVRMFQTVQYLVDAQSGSGRSAGALVAQTQLDSGSRTAGGGYVYGSPYLTSSFV